MRSGWDITAPGLSFDDKSYGEIVLYLRSFIAGVIDIVYGFLLSEYRTEVLNEKKVFDLRFGKEETRFWNVFLGLGLFLL